MKKIALLCCILFNCATFNIYAALSATCTLTNFTNTGGITFSFDIYVRGTDDPVNVGGTNFYINFNTSALSTPVISNQNSKYHNNGSYNPMLVDISSDRIKITIGYILGETAALLDQSLPIGERICTITLIIESQQNSNINWNGSTAMATPGFQAVNLTLEGSDNSLLPVELSSFTAVAKQNFISLKWETKTEVNNFGFEVQRLQDSKLPADQAGIGKFQDSEWEKIGFVQGNGNSNSPKNYTFTDKNPSGGSNFIYRLKQIDNDGKFEYSDEVEVELMPDKFALYQNYPNPFNPETNIKFSLPAASKVRLDIYNIIGEHVITLVDKEMEAGFYNIPFNAVDLSSGTYIYRIQTQDFSQTKKMLLLK